MKNINLKNIILPSLLTIFYLASTHLIFGQDVRLKEAREQFKQKNYQKVITLLEHQSSINQPTLTLLGKAYFQLNQPKQAITYLEQATQSGTKNAELQYWLGMAHFAILRSNIPFNKKGYYAHRVKKAFKAALQLDSTHIQARKELARYYLNAPRIAGGSVAKAKKHAKILQKYDKLIGYHLEATIHIKTKAYNQAKKIYLDLIKASLADKTTYYWLSEIGLRSKDFGQAFHYCQQSIVKYPDYLIGYYQYAKVASQAHKNIVEGIRYAQWYLRKDPENKVSPGNHWVYYRLGVLYQMQGNRVNAQQAFQKALEIHPDFKQAKKALRN